MHSALSRSSKMWDPVVLRIARWPLESTARQGTVIPSPGRWRRSAKFFFENLMSFVQVSVHTVGYPLRWWSTTLVVRMYSNCTAPALFSPQTSSQGCLKPVDPPTAVVFRHAHDTCSRAVELLFGRLRRVTCWLAPGRGASQVASLLRLVYYNCTPTKPPVRSGNIENSWLVG